MRRFLVGSFVAVVASLALVVVPSSVGVASADGEKVPSRVVVLSDHSTAVKTWSQVTFRVRLESEDGTPLAGRSMRVWDDSYARWRCCGPPPWRTTDANGEIVESVLVDGSSRAPVRIAAYWYGDDVYAKALGEAYQPVAGYTTSLAVTHAAAVVSGGSLGVDVGAFRSDAAAPVSAQGCVDGARASVTLSRVGDGAVVYDGAVVVASAGCTVHVDIPVNVTPGGYELVVAWNSTTDPWFSWRDEFASYSALVDVGWQHTFTDSYGGGVVLVNWTTREYRVSLADGRDSGVVAADAALTRTGVGGVAWRMDLAYGGAVPGPASGAFYSTGMFSASGTLSGLPWRLSR